MLTLLSPSKTQDFTPESRKIRPTQPALLSESELLMKELAKLSEKQIGTLMEISPKLSALNHERYQTFQTPFTEKNAKPAALAFQGDVYDGLDAASLTDKQLEAAQHTVRILSGLYGVLKPLDLIQPYRLEMSIALKNPRGKDLYKFWGDRLTELLNQHAKEEKTDLIVNLASNEYFSAIKPKKLNAQLVNVDFKENKNGELKIIAFFAKKARGMMARHLLLANAKGPEDIKSFQMDGYKFQPKLSTDSNLVFARKSKTS